MKLNYWKAIESHKFHLVGNLNITEEVKEFFGNEANHEKNFNAIVQEHLGCNQVLAQRLIIEYRRFIYLACISDEAMPSNMIHKVCQIHAYFAKDYTDFSKKIGKKFICKQSIDVVGSIYDEEDFSIIEPYIKTMELYRREFGHNPPSDIWPTPVIHTEDGGSSNLIDNYNYHQVSSDNSVISNHSLWHIINDDSDFRNLPDTSHPSFDGFGGGEMGGGGAEGDLDDKSEDGNEEDSNDDNELNDSDSGDSDSGDSGGGDGGD
jgi:hypothetical protein